jgi:hypothetical protein
MIKRFSFYFFLILLGCLSLSANNYFTNYQILSAYEKTISGNSIFYPLHFHDSQNALLVDFKNNRKIQWESESIPNFYGDQKITFAFTFSQNNPIGENASYKLFIDSIHSVNFEIFEGLTFSDSEDGIEIEIQPKEQNEELTYSGFGFIKIPIQFLHPGQNLQFSLESTAESDLDSWFAIYQSHIIQGVRFLDSEILVKKDGEVFRELGVEVHNFGRRHKINIRIDDTDFEIQAEPGIHYHPILLAENLRHREIEIETLVNDSVVSFERKRISPIKQRNIYLMNESYSYNSLFPDYINTDVNNLRQALTEFSKNDTRPVWSKFHWSVLEYAVINTFLKTASQEELELMKKAVRDGFLEISPAFKQIISSLSSPKDYSYLMEEGLGLLEESGAQSITQVQIDPSGMDARYLEYLLDRKITEIGVFQNNTYRTRPQYFEKFKKPYFYYSPYKTKPLLVYNQNDAVYYKKSQHALNAQTIANHQHVLKAKSFKYPNSLLRLIPTEGKIDSDISEFINTWNKEHKSPKLILSGFNGFAEQFRKVSGNKLKKSSQLENAFWAEQILNDHTNYSTENDFFQQVSDQDRLQAVLKKTNERKDVLASLRNYWDGRTSNIQYKSLHNGNHPKERIKNLNQIIGDKVKVYNPLSYTRSTLVKLPLTGKFLSAFYNDVEIPFQRISDSTVLVYMDQFEGHSVREIRFTKNKGEEFNFPPIKIEYDSKRGIHQLKSPLTEENILEDKSGLFQLNYIIGRHPKKNQITEKYTGFLKLADGPLCTIYEVHSEFNGIECIKEIYLYHPTGEIKTNIQLKSLPSEDFSVHMLHNYNLPGNNFSTVQHMFELERHTYNNKGNVNYFTSPYFNLHNQNTQLEFYCNNNSFWQIGEIAVDPKSYGWRSEVGYNDKYYTYLISNYFGYQKPNQDSYTNEFLCRISNPAKANTNYLLDNQYPVIVFTEGYPLKSDKVFEWKNPMLLIQQMYPHKEGKGIVLEVKNLSYEAQKMKIDWNGKRRYKRYSIDNSDKKTGILKGDIKWEPYELIRILLE